MKRSFLKSRAFFVALLIGVSISFFLGIFQNSKGSCSEYSKNYWFHLGRGEPIAWAGTSAVNKPVPWPFVKAPFLTVDIHREMLTSQVVKIIDLSRFLPLFLILTLVFYPVMFIFVRATEENKALKPFVNGLQVGLILFSVFFYFFWFPRV